MKDYVKGFKHSSEEIDKETCIRHLEDVRDHISTFENDYAVTWILRRFDKVIAYLQQETASENVYIPGEDDGINT